MNSIVEITGEGYGLSVSKGFLLVSHDGDEDKIPLSEIEAVVISSHGTWITNHALSRLAEENIPVVHCNRNAMPCALTLPYAANVYRKQRIQTQIDASQPLRKNLWQQVVRAKISNQAAVLDLFSLLSNDLKQLASHVLSGDKGNAEAIAARFYWERLFGTGFKRDPDLPGINSFLNYGYAILRASMCRVIVAAGLIPELGIHHHNQMNPFCLADDLMEPYRPFIDLLVKTLNVQSDEGLTPMRKKQLVSILDLGLDHLGEATHLRYCPQKTVGQFVRSLETKKPDLSYPVIDVGIHKCLQTWLL